MYYKYYNYIIYINLGCAIIAFGLIPPLCLLATAHTEIKLRAFPILREVPYVRIVPYFLILF